MLFSLYLLFLTILTTSLVLAARSGDPSQYDRPLDHFRLFCEVVTLIFVLYDLALEIGQFGNVVSVLHNIASIHPTAYFKSHNVKFFT